MPVQFQFLNDECDEFSTRRIVAIVTK
jgi:hypothetical protein